ncbi:MAG: MFS transporter [Dehalococcoidia bacterium]|nr:MFS transporter [Dehalococcoidia bacterium]
MENLRTAASRQRPGLFYGWWVLLALSAISFYVAGTFWWGFAVFFAAILDEFGWSRTEISLALTLQGLEGVGAAPIVGLLIDRVGTRKLMLFGLTTAGLGLVLLSQTSSLLWFYASFLVVSIGTSTGTGIVSQSLVVRWFQRQRGTATTILLMMPGLGATLIIPLLSLSIDYFGWRETLLVVGIGLWIVAVPVLLVVRDLPESLGLLPDGETPDGGETQLQGATVETHRDERSLTVAEALKLPAFWFLTATFALWNIATSGVQPHLFVALLGIGITKSKAAALTAFLPGISLIGRFGFGVLSDHINKRYLLLATGAAMTVGMAFLAALFLNPSRTWLTIPFLLFYSIGFGGSIPLRVVISGEYFGRRHFPAIYGTMQSVTAAGGVVGPLFAGWLFDTTGSYFFAFAVGCALMLVSLPLVLAISDRPAHGRDVNR